MARDIFHYDVQTGKHTQVTTNVGEDRSPFYTPDGKVVFLSERNGGSFNIYRADLQATDKAEALTSFRNHPIRFLTQAMDGTLCFGYQGEIYTLKPGGKPTKVDIEIMGDLDKDR